jgi:hypothetical protein
VEPTTFLDEFDQLCLRQANVISRQQALRYLSPSAVRHRLDKGFWHKATKAIYRVQPGRSTDEQRRWIALLAAGYPGRTVCLAGTTALQVWGLRRITSDAVHVLVAAGVKRVTSPGYVRLHGTRNMPDEEEIRNCRAPATLPARSLVDAAQWARTDKEARLIIAASFQQKLVRLRDVQDQVRQNTRRRELILATANDCSGGSHTLGELDLVKLCRKNGLPIPTLQVPVLDREGRRRCLDAVFEEYKVALEIDGVQHEWAERSWDEAERQNSLTLDDYLLLRFPNGYVREHPEKVVDAIRAALLKAGWRPKPPRLL